MNTNLSDWLELIPTRDLPRLLRGGEDDILEQIRGDIHALQACLRLMNRALVKRGEMLRYDELPPEMLDAGLYLGGSRHRKRRQRNRVVSPEQFAAMRERLESAVHELAGMFIRLEPVGDVLFEEHPDKERERRVEIYARQWAEIEELYDEDELLRQGPAAQAVWCHEAGRQFPSARRAARWCQDVLRKPKVRRSDIRTAIRRGCKCAGFTWSYLTDVPPQIIKNGCARPVRCVAPNGSAISFPSLTEAAAFAEVSTSTLVEAIESGGMLQDHRYAWDAKVAGDMAVERVLQDLCPLFAGVPIGMKPESAKPFWQEFPLFAGV